MPQIVFDNATGWGDMVVQNGALLTGNDLETAIIISLFTDALADDGDVIYDPDLMGWWGDRYSAVEDSTLPVIQNDRIGSKLWQVFNRPRNQDTLNWMADQIRVALNWMIVDGVAQSFDVGAVFTSNGGVGAQIAVTRAGVRNTYAYAWAQDRGTTGP
jgi:phage gp46-like protein